MPVTNRVERDDVMTAAAAVTVSDDRCNNTKSVLSSLVRSASQLRGLAFCNRLDELLLPNGISSKTLTFLYGKREVERMMNVLCGNAVQIFGGRAVYIDACNSFDPYTIVKSCTHPKTSDSSERLLRSITISRAFTCYQLTDLVMDQLDRLVIARGGEKPAPVRFIAVCGIDSVFNEQDNTKTEIERLQHLMASSLRRIASDRRNEVLFVVASSTGRCESFIEKSDIAIKLFDDEKTGNAKAVLMKHYSRRFAEIEL